MVEIRKVTNSCIVTEGASHPWFVVVSMNAVWMLSKHSVK